jgi:hypothetical protein
LLLATALSGCTRRAPETRQWTYRGQFHEAVRQADRIVVRDGGFKGPTPLDQQRILFQITDPAEVRRLSEGLRFQPDQKPSPCSHWGYPGIDWYQGERRLAMTAVLHYKMIRWDRFPGDNDAVLTSESATWLKRWLLGHGIGEDKLR